MTPKYLYSTHFLCFFFCIFGMRNLEIFVDSVLEIRLFRTSLFRIRFLQFFILAVDWKFKEDTIQSIDTNYIFFVCFISLVCKIFCFFFHLCKGLLKQLKKIHCIHFFYTCMTPSSYPNHHLTSIIITITILQIKFDFLPYILNCHVMLE